MFGQPQNEKVFPNIWEESTCVSVWSYNWAPPKRAWLCLPYHPLFRCFYTLIISPLRAFSSLGWTVPVHNLSTEKRSSYHFIIFVALGWTSLQYVHVCLLLGAQTLTQCFRSGLTGAKGTASTCRHQGAFITRRHLLQTCSFWHSLSPTGFAVF